MRRFQSLYSVVLLALLSSLTLVGCRDALFDRSFPDCSEQQEAEVTPGTLEDGVTMTLAYESHALKTPGTLRAALSVEQESDLKLATTRVLIFNSNGEYQYDAPLTKITPDASDHQKGTLTVQIKPGQGLGIVVLANLTEAEKTRKVSGTKADILKTFAYSVAQATDFSSVGIPMFGEVTQVEVKTDTQPVPTLGKTIHLLRAVARVDVGLKMSAAGTTGMDGDFDETASGLISTIVEPADRSSKKVKWTLLETKFFNAASQGLVVPAEGNYSLDGDKPKATAPTLPQTPGKQTLTYAVTDNLLKRNIYIPETGNPEPEVTQNGNETDPTKDTYYLKRPYLILKLQYDEVDDSNKIKAGGAKGTTYFRIDFLKREGEEATAKYTYLPLLRNHRYKVDIRNIGGLGFDNEDDAKKGPSANIMYNVLVWDESAMTDVQYDGQYMLGVSAKTANGYKSGGTVDFKVQTSWPKGFVIEGLPDGFTANPTSYDGIDEKTVNITYPAWDGTTGLVSGQNYREIKFKVRAGRMLWPVTLRQHNTDRLEVQLFSDPKLTMPLQYLSVHELGEAMLQNPATDVTFDNTKYYGSNQMLIDRYKTTGAISAPWFDMDAVQKSIETDAPTFTALTSGAVRIFYAKVYGPADAVLDTPAPTDGTENGFTIRELTDTSLPASVHKFMVTAKEMVDSDDYFEHRYDEYGFTVSSQSAGRTSDPAKLVLDQQEYDAAIYTDSSLKIPLYADEEPFVVMDGNDKTYYIKSNATYYLIYFSQKGSELTDAIAMDAATGDLKSGYLAMTDLDGKAWNTPLEGTANFLGREFQIGTRDDLTNPVVRLADVTVKVKLDRMPYHIYKDRTANARFVSAKILTEDKVANSYLMETNGGGIAIPYDKWVNDATNLYNRNVSMPNPDFSREIGFSWNEFLSSHTLKPIDVKLDEPSAEVLWTDVYTSAPAGSVVGNDNSALRMRMTAKLDGKLYLLVMPGALSGNTVVGLRSSYRNPLIPYYDGEGEYNKPGDNGNGNHAILWSFHFIVYPKGQMDTKKILSPNFVRNGSYTDTYYYTSANYTVRFMQMSLGAMKAPELDPVFEKKGGFKYYRDDTYVVQGMGYQWGRKDPCPKYATGKGRKFYNDEGREVTFDFWKGDGTANRTYHTVSGRMSVRETIERPMRFVESANGAVWMLEGGYDSSGSGSLAPNQARDAAAWQVSMIWGGGSPLDLATQRTQNVVKTSKTQFDPSPYGFVIPTNGYMSSAHLTGAALTWGFEYNVPYLKLNWYNSSGYSNHNLKKSGSIYVPTSLPGVRKEYPCFYVTSDTTGQVNDDMNGPSRANTVQVRPVLQMSALGDWKQIQCITIVPTVDPENGYGVPRPKEENHLLPYYY